MRIGVSTWFAGEDVVFDYSEVRPVGSAFARERGPGLPCRNRCAKCWILPALVFFRDRVSLLRPLDAHDMMWWWGCGSVRWCAPYCDDFSV
ncbi:MAG: hypothetical protein M5U34_33015 [Chloroflexi bacterium]|nr:hypothetical protein [Chloroflexota bacterium]